MAIREHGADPLTGARHLKGSDDPHLFMYITISNALHQLSAKAARARQKK